jgi:hypothetical protein
MILQSPGSSRGGLETVGVHIASDERRTLVHFICRECSCANDQDPRLPLMCTACGALQSSEPGKRHDEKRQNQRKKLKRKMPYGHPAASQTSLSQKSKHVEYSDVCKGCCIAEGHRPFAVPPLALNDKNHNHAPRALRRQISSADWMPQGGMAFPQEKYSAQCGGVCELEDRWDKKSQDLSSLAFEIELDDGTRYCPIPHRNHSGGPDPEQRRN